MRTRRTSAVFGTLSQKTSMIVQTFEASGGRGLDYFIILYHLSMAGVVSRNMISIDRIALNHNKSVCLYIYSESWIQCTRSKQTHSDRHFDESKPTSRMSYRCSKQMALSINN